MTLCEAAFEERVKSGSEEKCWMKELKSSEVIYEERDHEWK